MADEPIEGTPAGTEGEAPATGEPAKPVETPPVDEAKEALKRDVAAERKKRQELEKALKDLQDGTLTEKELLTRERDAAAKELAELKLSGLKAEACRKAKIDVSLAGRLLGSTAEELEADAKELAKTVRSANPLPNDGAARANTAATATDMNAQIRAMFGK